MRISPKNILHGLFYSTPVLLLALAACGGGGGGGTSATLAAYYPLSVSVTGVSGVNLVLRNGGDDLPVSAPGGTFSFAHPVLSGTTYNISVKTQPSSPTQRCTFSNATTSLIGTMPASAKTVAVTCVKAYTINANITTSVSTGLVLQNNGGDNLLIPASSVAQTQTFSTPLPAADNFAVTVLTQPPAMTCTTSGAASGVVSTSGATVSISCAAAPTSPPPDQHVYVANYGTGTSASTALTYAASGVLTTPPAGSSSTGIAPSAIAVFGGKYAFVTNRNSNTVSSYGVTTSGVLSATPIANTATGTTPFAIAIHPSGKFAYVVNEGSNSISAYSIDASTGALASIDADAYTTGMQASISTGAAYTPVAIAIDPAGTYAYVASLGNGTYSTSCGTGSTTIGCVSAYKIDQSTGALTSVTISGSSNYIATGQTPSSIAIDSANVYVTNSHNDNVFVYPVSNGQLSPSTPFTTGTGPSSIALNPVSSYAYVANATGNTVSIFSISLSNLLPVGTANTGAAPASIAIDSTGQYAYVANSGDDTISTFKITKSNPYLTPVGTTSNPAGTHPVSVTTAP